MFPSWSKASDSDVQAITQQLGKSPRGLLAVARRCRFGSPQVVVTSPVVFGPGRRSERCAGVVAGDARVFPTTYWLTCPHLSTAVARLEGDGWVGRLKAWLEGDVAAAQTQAKAHARAARERLSLVEPLLQKRLQEEQPAQWQVLTTAGVGGIRVQAGVKCLHAHTADYLAGPIGAERPGVERGPAAPAAEHRPAEIGSRNPVGAMTLSLLLQSGVDITGWPDCRGCLALAEGVAGASPAFSHIVAMDVGTNSCRLLDVEQVDGTLQRKGAALETTRLGEGLQASGCLAPRAIERTVAGLRSLLAVIDTSIPQTQVVAVATNAVRSAQNAADFLVAAWEDLGLAVRVVTGQEEAELSFRGALEGLKSQCSTTSAPVSVLDIGGGSTELVVGDWDGSITWSGSVDIGAVRLTELCSGLAHTGDALASVVGKAEKLLGDLRGKGGGGLLVGVGGTCTTLAAIDMQMADYQADFVQGYTLTVERVAAIADRLLRMPLEERRQTPGLQPARADIIVAGAAILLAAMRILGQSQVVVSDSDILFGTAQQFFGACASAGSKL